ncbi:MAG TPA: hypothetical protein VFT65_08965 [Candidatus Angelobacter sp.]|nr:hypothetical protein [Candidatus Angelobacter sp.]
MPDNAPPNPTPDKPAQAAPRPSPASQPNAGHIPITEELDSAKWTLPPILPLLAGLALVAVVLAVVLTTTKAKPSASLKINKVVSADQQGNTMVAVQVKVDNQVETPLWIQNINAELEMPDGRKYRDRAATSVDAPRYMEAFPALEEARADWLHEELKIPSKTSYTGTAIFSFPVSKVTFDGRKAISLRIEMYDHPSMVVVETPPAKP